VRNPVQIGKGHETLILGLVRFRLANKIPSADDLVVLLLQDLVLLYYRIQPNVRLLLLVLLPTYIGVGLPQKFIGVLFDGNGRLLFLLLVKIQMVFLMKEGVVLRTVSESVGLFVLYPLSEKLTIYLDRTQHAIYLYC
jgi:hypothetical protein